MFDVNDHTDDLRLAHMLADSADRITMERFGAQDLHVESKPDATPVTDADLAVEKALRSTLGRLRSRDSVHGEEFADTGDSDRRWVIDPIDGTKNFLRGVPVWATLIALMIENRVVMGVVSAPAFGQRWWAAAGAGAGVGAGASATGAGLGAPGLGPGAGRAEAPGLGAEPVARGPGLAPDGDG